jgi:Cohesin domain
MRARLQFVVGFDLITVLLGLKPGFAQTSLSVGTVRGYPGLTVSVPVQIGKATNVTAAQFDVTYDPGKVTPADSVLGASLSNHVIRSREIAPGVRRVLLYSTANSSITVTSRAEVARMPFTVAPHERVHSGPITPVNAILATADPAALRPLALAHGTIFVSPVYREPSGIVDLFLPSTADERYLFQATTDLVTWVTLSTNLATGSFIDLVDRDAPQYLYRFYRIRPN